LSNRKGFTLIELLVVIAIIAILAAILFPVFITARERGKIAFCVSNMKNIHTGLTMYADDFNGGLPRDPNPTNWNDIFWSEQIRGFGDMWNYVKKDNVFFCPTARPPRTSVTNPEASKKDVEILYKIYHKEPNRAVYLRGSYHFWPQLFRVGDQPARLDDFMQVLAVSLKTST
jgi:prepilin-type N-terminal cleavage/methylation domain-containing protein